MGGFFLAPAGGLGLFGPKGDFAGLTDGQTTGLRELDK